MKMKYPDDYGIIYQTVKTFWSFFSIFKTGGLYIYDPNGQITVKHIDTKISNITFKLYIL